MSARTKPLLVYVIWRADGAHKIGVSWYPEGRMCDIRRNTPGFPEMRLVRVWDRHGDASRVESTAHGLLKEQALGGEWFSVSEEEAEDAVCAAIKRIESPEPLAIKQEADAKAYDLLSEYREVRLALVEQTEVSLGRRMTRPEVNALEESGCVDRIRMLIRLNTSPYAAGKKLGIKASTVTKWKLAMVEPVVDDLSKEEPDAE